MIRWLPAIACIVAAPLAVAQTLLPPVTVTATRTKALPFDVPAAVTSIDGDRAREAGRPELSLAESVSLVPGVAARDRQNYAQDLQLSIRGFGARSSFGVRGIRIYVDGIPATMPDGQGQLSHIDLASAGRIELLRGPFSVLYGNSSGGVLQVFTDEGEGPPSVTASMAAGSFGLSRPGLRVSGANGAFHYVVSASHLDLSGWREHETTRRDLANARLDWHVSDDRKWTLVANSVDLAADDPLGLSRSQFQAAPRTVDPAALTFDTRKTVRQDQLGLVHEARLQGGDQLRLMAYAGRRDTTQFQSIPVGVQANPQHPGGVIGLERSYSGTDLRWTRRAEGMELVAGLSWDQLQEHRQGWLNFIGTQLGVQGALRRDEHNDVSDLDPYVQGTWRIAPDWSLVAGARHSSVRFSSDSGGSARYSATLPAVGIMFKVSPAVHLYATAGKGFETPTLNEVAYRPNGAPGLNFALRPSRSDNVEAGMKWRLEAPLRLEGSLAAFATRTTDEIVTQTSSGGRSTYQNAGRTRRQGVEAEAALRFGRDGRLQLAQTWLDARYADAFLTCAATPCAAPSLLVPTGNRIPGTAASMTAVELSWRPERGWRGGVEVRRSARVAVNDVNSEFAPSFTTVSLNAGYGVEVGAWKLSADARVDNLFDRRYANSVIVNEGNGRFYEPGAGRGYVLKLSAGYAF